MEAPPPRPKPTPKRLPLEPRFWSHVREWDGDCWRWGAQVDAKGYGRFSRGAGRGGYAHRMAYTLARGPLPPGTRLANRCGECACVNPEHWAPSTSKEVARAWRSARKEQGES